MQRFGGEVVIVTGAGSGIGAATAKRFSGEGASVVLAGRDPDRLRQAAAELPPDRTLVYQADVAEAGQVEAMVAATVARFGALHTMVNNAGVASFGGFLDLPVDEWRRVMQVDVDGVFHGCRAALPHLLKTRGSIVNVSSVSGLGGDWNMSFYNAAKGAVSNLTRSLALEFGAQGVRINAVAPSLTFTGMTAKMKQNAPLMAKFAERIPMGRGAEPEEVAAVIAFLASEDAEFVTGVVLPVDGGLSASNGQPRLG